MNIKIIPSTLVGKVSLPPSKSDLQRLILLSAFGKDGKTTRIEIPPCASLAEDIKIFADAVNTLGGKINIENSCISVTPISKTNIDNKKIYLGESGAAARFLIPAIAFSLREGEKVSFDGGGSLRKRPLTAVEDALTECGFDFSSSVLPFAVTRKSGKTIMSVTANRTLSSQIVSGFLLAFACSALDGDINVTGRKSSDGYVALTVKRLSDFGFDVKREKSDNGEIFHIKKITGNISDVFRAESDMSAASFWLCAAHGENKTDIENFDAGSLQPDAVIVDYIRSITETTGKKCKIILDMDSSPDIFPPLAAFSAVTEGSDVTFIGVERLKFKESDRLSSSCEMINSLGGCAAVTEFDGGIALNVRGAKKLCGGIVNSYGDHRIAMSAAITAAFCENDVIITDADCTDKSYPDFWETYNSIGGKAICLPFSETK